MLNYVQSMSKAWILRIGVALAFILVMMIRLGYGENQRGSEAILQGNIQIQTLLPVAGNGEKIQPGTPVKLKLEIENIGEAKNPSGEVYIRFAFAKPLEKEKNSVIFQTEKKALPSIEAGQKLEMTFDTQHQWPAIL